MRSGDHLCADVHEYHANTALYETEEDKLLNDELPDIYKDNLEVGVLGLNNKIFKNFISVLSERRINRM